MKLRYLALAAVVAMGVGGVATYQPPDPAPSVVKLQLEQGHGSAVHIGGGYFVTAAHVTGGRKEVNYLSIDGDTGVAVTLWESKDYDIALVYDPSTKVASSDLDCRSPVNGEDVSFIGNPQFLEFITTNGKIAGTPREVGMWKNVLPIDGALIGGMSGGGVFDTGGDMVGVIVGGMMFSDGYSRSPSGINFIVPASDVCFLMGRG